MALRILHVLCSNFFAGSVAYAVQLAEQQTKNGHEVIVMTDMDLSCRMFTSKVQAISDRSMGQRLRNIMAIRDLLASSDISVVHAHSRASSWVCHYALKGSRIPLISTIHGRQVKHGKHRKMDIYGDRAIAICPNLADHLINEIQLDQKKLLQIPNGINTEALQGVQRTLRPKRYTLSIIGRFNGVKGEVIAEVVQHVLPSLLSVNLDLHVQFVGMEWDAFPARGKKAFDHLVKDFPGRIEYLGFRTDIHQVIADSNLVMGAGRVALTALFLKVPVFALGEAACHGLITRMNLEQAIATNFGDVEKQRGVFKPDTDEMIFDLHRALRDSSGQEVLTALLGDFDQAAVYPKVMQVYREAMMEKVHKGWIPVLMYHRVPERPSESRHRTFVTRDRFRKHLRFFRMRGLTAITFRDHEAFADGTRSLRTFPKHPFIMTFDDGYADNHRNMLPLVIASGHKGVLYLLGDGAATHNHWDTGEPLSETALMSMEQKRDFVSAGWEIGAHTMTHPDLTGLSEKEMVHELTESKRRLEQDLSTPVDSFAYPYGHYNEAVLAAVQGAGYKYGVATDNGGMHIEDDHYAIFRVNMFPNESLLQLFKKTSSWYRAYYRRSRNK